MVSTENQTRSKDRYILITQCLQKDFLENTDCKLCIDEEERRRLLHGENGEKSPKVENGPLYCFLKSTVGEVKNKNRDDLYIIHIRDHHESSNENYQHEMMKYGRHCEIDTDGWEFLDKEFKPFFELDNLDRDGDDFIGRKKERIFEVKSTSIHDFKPEKQGEKARLERILDYLIFKEPKPENKNIYILVIGVYTDIKVKILVTDLRTRYRNINIAVASSLTASRSIERHISALDFMKKVLDVVIVHKIPNLLAFLGEKSNKILSECKDCKEGDDFYKEYGDYEVDKQKIIDYAKRKRLEFRQMVGKKAERLYSFVYWLNIILAIIGVIFLIIPIIKVLAIGNVILFNFIFDLNFAPLQYSFVSDAIFGGIGLGAFSIIFFSKRMSILQKNLTNFAQFAMLLDSHSLKTAIAQHHLTTPIQLRNVTDSEKIDNQQKSVKLIKQKIEALGLIDSSTNQLLYSLLYTDEDFEDILKGMNLLKPKIEKK